MAELHYSCLFCGKDSIANQENIIAVGCGLCPECLDKAFKEAEEEREFKGYWGTNANGERFHTFDFEESIGE